MEYTDGGSGVIGMVEGYVGMYMQWVNKNAKGPGWVIAAMLEGWGDSKDETECGRNCSMHQELYE